MEKQSNAPAVVHQIVGRVHVGASNRAVIRYFVSRLKKGYRTWVALPRAERKQWLKWVIEVRAGNRALYCYVMGGCR